jgi:hypothetical protein
MKVFEFGCGHSSLWWARRVQEVVSVDHDIRWVKYIQKNKPNNLTLFHSLAGTDSSVFSADVRNRIESIIAAQVVSPDKDHNVAHGLDCRNYLSHPATLARYPKQNFDIIVVDGMARSVCAYIAGLWVKDEGIIVFDNSDRWQYGPGYDALRELGFARFDFFGIGPINSYEWCTSIFAKSITPFMNIAPREKIPNDIDWSHQNISAMVPSRNQLCPCGSGRKYKHCCGTYR